MLKFKKTSSTPLIRDLNHHAKELFTQQNPVVAQTKVHEALSLENDPVLKYNLATTLLAQEKFENADVLFEEASQENGQLLFNYAVLKHRQGKIEEAHSLFKKQGTAEARWALLDLNRSKESQLQSLTQNSD